MGNNNRKLTAALLLAAGLALPLAVSASKIEDITAMVQYDDLDVHDEADAEVLYDRLQRASEEACDVGASLVQGSMTAAAKAKRCYKKTLAAAVEKIDSEALSRIHGS